MSFVNSICQYLFFNWHIQFICFYVLTDIYFFIYYCSLSLTFSMLHFNQPPKIRILTCSHIPRPSLPPRYHQVHARHTFGSQSQKPSKMTNSIRILHHSFFTLSLTTPSPGFAFKYFTQTFFTESFCIARCPKAYKPQNISRPQI